MRFRDVQDGGGGVAGALARAGLAGMSLGYRAAVALRSLGYAGGLLRTHRLPRPVVSVGNLTAGGTGKTPFVAWLAARLLERGAHPGTLARGYGPKPAGSDLSDEGTLLRDLLGARVPQVEDPDRLAGGAALLAAHPTVDVLLLDDGFQHRRLARDLDVVLLDATDPLGGGRLLPRGRLREPVGALARAHVVGLTRAERLSDAALEALRADVRRRAPEADVVVVRTRATALVGPRGDVAPLAALRGARVALYAGIGNPAAFEATVVGLGAEVVARRFVRDHHLPTAPEADALARLGSDAGGRLVVTTRKDLVKLRALPGLPDAVVALDVEAEVSGGDALVDRVLALRGPATA